MSSFGEKTTGEEVAARFRGEIQGKNVLITGASLNTLGAEVVRVLAPYANLIVIAGRSRERMEETVSMVKSEIPKSNIRLLVINLLSLSSVRAAAAEVNAYEEPIHVLFNNAAGPHAPFTKTEDGFESLFAANHLAHFLFTNLILDKIRAAATPSFPSRIINVSSTTHAWPGAEMRWDDLNYTRRNEEYNKYTAYLQSKTANILFTRGLAKRLKDSNVLTFSLHPGGIWTRLTLSVPKADLISFGFMDAEGNITDAVSWKTIPEGTSTHLVAAFDPSLKDHSGGFLVDCQLRNDLLAPHASDDENATKLWEMSEELLGQQFLSETSFRLSWIRNTWARLAPFFDHIIHGPKLPSK